MIDVNNLRKGVTFELDGTLYKVLEYSHHKPGRGNATIRIKAINLRSGANLEKTFQSGDRVQEARLDFHNVQYLYSDGDLYHFMDLETFEQPAISAEIVGEAANARESIVKAHALRPDVVLMDIRMEEGNDAGGIDACRQIRSELPETQVIMFTSYSQRESVLASIMAGATGFLTKNVGHAQLVEAIRAVGRGQSLFGSPDHDTELFQSLVAPLPLAGFFCNGEIGPVGGSTFLHGYTSSFAIFSPAAAEPAA